MGIDQIESSCTPDNRESSLSILTGFIVDYRNRNDRGLLKETAALEPDIDF
jgi:hypothetical protein